MNWQVMGSCLLEFPSRMEDCGWVAEMVRLPSWILQMDLLRSRALRSLRRMSLSSRQPEVTRHVLEPLMQMDRSRSGTWTVLRRSSHSERREERSGLWHSLTTETIFTVPQPIERSTTLILPRIRRSKDVSPSHMQPRMWTT